MPDFMQYNLVRYAVNVEIKQSDNCDSNTYHTTICRDRSWPFKSGIIYALYTI